MLNLLSRVLSNAVLDGGLIDAALAAPASCLVGMH